jgi:hypothetical protein
VREVRLLLAHPLFPVFAALWFAALFGLGSLAISSNTLGAVIVKTGLPAIIPATAPPLGFTAHALLALILAIAGGAIGTAIGMAIQRRLPNQEPAPIYAPLRRSSAATPAPPRAQPATPEAPKVRARDAHPDAPPRRPLDLTDALVADAIPRAPAVPEVAAAPAPERTLQDLPANIFASTPAVFAHAAQDVDVAAEDEPILLSELAPPELPEPEPAMLVASPAPLQDAAINAARAAGLVDGDALARKLLADLPIDGLGMLQLIERLALALETRRVNDQSAPAAGDMPAHSTALDTTPFEAPSRFALPVSGSGLGAVADAMPEEPAATSSTQPLSVLTEKYAALLAAAPGGAAGSGDARTAADPVLQFPGEAARHGLAAVRQQARATPAAKATFPAPRPHYATAEEADAALREALATLKRMASQG